MKKKISFLSLIMATSLIFVLLASCNGQGKGGEQAKAKDFEVAELTLWGKDILTKEKVTLEGKDKPKSIGVLVTNCEEYTLDVVFSGNKTSTTAAGGSAEMEFADVPKEEKTLVIKLSASGMNDYSRVVKIKLSDTEAKDLKVLFAGNKEVMDVNPVFNTTKDSETITIKTTDSQMTKVTIDGDEINLGADGKSATHNLTVTGTGSNPQEVTVTVEFRYFATSTRTFKVSKYSNESDFPLGLISAAILSGDDEGNKNKLTFDSSKKASVELEDIRYSTVKLVMEFDQALKSREVKKCEDERDAEYAKKITGQGIVGTFSGYVTHDVNMKGEETELKQIEGSTYTEILIAGHGTVSYQIEVTAQNDKKETYTIEIKNELPGFVNNKPNVAAFMKDVTVFNGHSGRPAFYGMFNAFFLTYYNKGPSFVDKNLSEKAAFENLTYMENFATIFMQRNTEEPFYLYYNLMNDEGSKPKDEHKFKRVKAIKGRPGPDGKPRVLAQLVINDMADKYFDAFLSAKETLPNPMLFYYYDQKWKKASPKHGFLLKLKNNVQCKWDNEDLGASDIFDYAFNYRIQTMYYDKQNKNGGSVQDSDYLTIAEQHTIKYWETGVQENGWKTPYLSGKDGDDKDKFFLQPLFDPALIKTVKYTLKCGDEASGCADVSEYKDITITADGNGMYPLGVKNSETVPSYAFVDGKVYKLEVEVEYTDGNGSEKDKFYYILDYKNPQTLELLDLADEHEESSNLFGVPTSYGVEKLDPAIIREMAGESCTVRSFM